MDISNMLFPQDIWVSISWFVSVTKCKKKFYCSAIEVDYVELLICNHKEFFNVIPKC